MHRLGGTFPKLAGILFGIEREAQAVRDKAEAVEGGQHGAVHVVLNEPFVRIDILLQLLYRHLFLAPVAVLRILPDLGSTHKKRHFRIAERNKIVINIPVRADTAGELELLGRIDDEVCSRAHVAQHFLSAVKHRRILRVSLDITRRDTVDFTQLAPARLGKLLEQGMGDGLVQQPVITRRTELQDIRPVFAHRPVIIPFVRSTVIKEQPFFRHDILPGQKRYFQPGRVRCRELYQRMAVEYRFQHIAQKERKPYGFAKCPCRFFIYLSGRIL